MVEHTIWTEKYRPKTFEEVIGHKPIVEKIQAFVEQQNMPHVLFSGPAGTGKTTLSLVIANQIFKTEHHSNFLELNASDERGIDVVRVKVKDFARTKSIADVPFKIIYLDECDSLTKDAQQALRRTMETYSKSCRFILSCNYVTKIIDPIKSRCSIFRFKPLTDEDIKELTNTIIQKEQLTVSEDAKELLLSTSQGDVRRLYNILQSSAVVSKNITADTIKEIASTAEPKEIKFILQETVNNNFLNAKKLTVDTLLNNGLSALDMIKLIQREIWDLNVPDNNKLQMVEKCGEIEFRLTEGSDPYVQLDALIAYFTYLNQK